MARSWKYNLNAWDIFHKDNSSSLKVKSIMITEINKYNDVGILYICFYSFFLIYVQNLIL